MTTFRCRRSLLVCLLLFALSLCAAEPAATSPPSGPLKIAIIPFYAPDKIYSLYQPMVDHLNKVGSRRWELALGDTHDVLVRKLAAGELSIALLGPIPYAQARKLAPVRPLLLALTPDGKTHYHSVLVTADPSVSTLADVRGKPVAVFPRSTAAHYLPMVMLAEEGLLTPPPPVVECSSQDRLVAALLNNKAAVGGVKEGLLSTLNDPRLRSLKVSRALPQFVFVAAPSLSPEDERAFVDALRPLAPLSRPADRALMKGWDAEIANGFVTPPPEFSRETEELLLSVSPFLVD